ncbi:MAG TPA: tRNA pseudouridine(55) synthase TruB [Steroidobacteraceae bacterium]|jgi:tRNA pseudouridine55 synthase|nr:tRNA pseudouridine(55) synthase TruB [Steroidobacteraceae bacterium]
MPSGILLLDKPRGLSSNAALQRVRALFGREKAGHVGSLDPLATGMLPICLGEATKVAGEILAGRKCYRFTVTLGARTTTGDAEGAVSERAGVPPLERSHLEAVLARFLGPGQQIPPMYSAIKRAGQPLYRLARAGLTVERLPRAIEVASLRLLALGPHTLELEVLCSKGTYVRVLAEDIAAALNTLGHVSVLRREYVEPFEREPMHTLESLAATRTRGEEPALLPVDHPLGHLPAVHLDPEAARRVCQGQAVRVADAPRAARVRLYGDRRFLGIGASDAAGAVHPRRLLRL